MKEGKRTLAAHCGESIDHSAFRCNAQEGRTIKWQAARRRRLGICAAAGRPSSDSPAHLRAASESVAKRFHTRDFLRHPVTIPALLRLSAGSTPAPKSKCNIKSHIAI
ncbi:hypothetical protein [Burkholderia sp. Bp8963]|uniref:hypothetical protein n=1 Tax=Burkholderia sp. Bp8963 TaxID=2184547 RepID=UPI000F5A9E71|nr:hypothetical protein [Burkholderia sp. Bp8963]